MSKRGQNEGSIYQMKDGRWRAAISLGWKNGSRARKTFTAKTRRDVQEKLTAVLHSQQLGIPVSTDKQSVSQFLENWLENVVRNRVRPKTFTSYCWIVRQHLIPDLGRVPLQKLSPPLIQQLLNAKLENGLTARTVQHIHAILRIALGQAEKWNLVPRNVATLIEAPRVQRAEIRPMSPQEAQEFLEAMKNDRMEALYSVAIALGLRQGEALGLLWTDIDLNRRTLTVQHTLQRISGKLKLVEPKTQKSRRTITLPQIATNALNAHRIRQDQERQLAGSSWQETGFVFTCNSSDLI